MKDILKGFSKDEREAWLSRLKRKLDFRESNTIRDDVTLTIELDKVVTEKLNEFCSTFEISRDRLLTMLICDFLIAGKVRSPIDEMAIDPISIAEGLRVIFGYPEDNETH